MANITDPLIIVTCNPITYVQSICIFSNDRFIALLDSRDSKSCKALYAPAPLDPNTVFDEITAKHPPASQPPDLARSGAANCGLVPAVDAEAVVIALKSFSTHSGAGPSGLRPFHLRQALESARTG